MYIGSLIRAYAAWRQYRKAVAQLYSLDDRMLRDIGLDRASIPHAAQNGLGR
jgi:uncharacterized protein YjiS (DUF1127 family)